jgi:tRNA dimethylallyltransferase
MPAKKRKKTATRKRERESLPRVVFVVGPTSSGKTDLGVKIARRFDGEIINADSRQLYKFVDIGTGKPTGKRGQYHHHKAFMHKGVPHYLMDFLHPAESYAAPQWREAAMKAVSGITRRGHLPVVVGGTGLYISSIVDNLQFPEVEPHPAFRRSLGSKPLRDLIALLLVLDPDAFEVVDIKNKRRVIRALEVLTFSGKRFSELRKKGEPVVRSLQVGIARSAGDLNARIRVAVERMVKRGLVREIRELMKRGLPLNAPALTALGYRDFADYLLGRVTLEQAMERLKKQTMQYAKRQLTWFRRDLRIHWVKDEEEGVKVVGEWLGAKDGKRAS